MYYVMLYILSALLVHILLLFLVKFPSNVSSIVCASAYSPVSISNLIACLS